MDIKILKTQIRFPGDSKNYYIKYFGEDDSFATFKSKIFERVPELKEKPIKIYWTGILPFFFLIENFAIISNFYFFLD